MEMKRYSTILQNKEIESIAIGRFDGVHIGHQVLIDKLNKNAALVIVEKHKATITPDEYRCKYVELDCILLNFEKIKQMSALEFIHYLKENFINLKKIVVGYDFRFAKFANAGVNELKELFDGEVLVVDEVMHAGISVHSKEIREMISNGDIKGANTLLGRGYEIYGKVIKGQGVGSRELFATINIDYRNFITPKNGVYASWIKIDDKVYKAATFVGNRLSTDCKFSIETHVLDENIKNVPDEVSIKFIDFLRENKKFDNLEMLKDQIDKDLSIIRSI